MALKKPVLAADSTYGIPCPEAYHRIFRVIAQREREITNAEVVVHTFYDHAAYTAGKQPLGVSRQFRFEGLDVGDATPVLQLLYGALKTLPEFATAEDC